MNAGIAPAGGAILLAVLVFFFPATTTGVNTSAALARHADLSAFAELLATTGVAAELDRRSAITLLAVPNSVLRRVPFPSSADLADVIRYHILLQYLSPADLRQIPPAGRLVATLYQATGRAAADRGDVNLTRSASGVVSVRGVVLNFLFAAPYNVSVFAVDGVLVPSGLDLAAADGRPSPGVNVSEVLVNGGDFNVAAAMLAASGVAAELVEDQRGAGITVFVPSDESFSKVPRWGRLQGLPAEKKAALLRFHVLHCYYPLGSLESIVNPVQPTLATEGSGAGRFTLDIARANGSLAIDTGLVRASITRTVYDQNPVAVFAVSRVLLPKEIFGVVGGAAAPPAEAAAFPPEEAFAAAGPSPMGQASGGARSAEFFLGCCVVGILRLLLV
ncbi:fasciclin-like arabinogalactan family protein [Wolffia australiana]